MVVKDLIYEPFLVDVTPEYQCAVHRMHQNMGGIPVIMLHGSIENGRIFYSLTGKGLAPFMARNGYDVFVIDLRGRGESVPKVKRGFKGDMHDTIQNDLPKIMEFIAQKVNPNHRWIMVGHSWGGVLLLSLYARFHNQFPMAKMVFFGSKRMVRMNSWPKWRDLGIGWAGMGLILDVWYGYFPSKDVMKMGSDNEPAAYHKNVVQWVFNKAWSAPDGLDYRKTLQQCPKIPVLNIMGRADKVLGHPDDCLYTLAEINYDHNVTSILLSKQNGFSRDYGHNDMLFHKNALNEHFTTILQWLKSK